MLIIMDQSVIQIKIQIEIDNQFVQNYFYIQWELQFDKWIINYQYFNTIRVLSERL